MFFQDFQLLQDTAVPSLHGRALRLRHRCGLELFCLDSPERENLFALHFKTPPTDNTGVAHILEHTVLSGSRKFPLRDPFIELVKSSLATFINAITFADCTVYPVSSCHEKDFFNLAEVYWDAVFHPLLSLSSFQQEAWHYEIAEDGKGKTKLEVNGIVLNEMSGAYAEMENVLERSAWQYLLPDSHLAFDSGGHPEQISLLTYQQFLNYYQDHYQPAKAKVIFIGNIPIERKLEFVRRQLADVPDAASALPSEFTPIRAKKWRVPRQKRVYYVPEPGQEKDDGAVLLFAWRMDERRDPDLDLAMQLLDLLLLGNQSAPLKKTLLESGLCSAITSSGYDDSSSQAIFQVGARGCKAENFDQLQKLIFDCLEEQSRGISKKRVLAAKRQLRLEHTEIGPEYTLDVFEDILAAWNANCDPALFLNQEDSWKALEENLAKDPTYLESLLKKYFLLNPHRLRLELLPDASLLARRERRISSRLRRLQSGMSSQELHDIHLQQLALQKAQRKPDPPSARRRLPRLSREHLSPLPPSLPVTESLLSNQLPLLTGDVFTNQVSYLQMAFDLSALPSHLRPALSLFSTFFHQVGTHASTYDIIAEQQAEASLSIRARLAACEQADGLSGMRNLLIVSMQCLDECLPEALGMLLEQLHNKSFQETKRCQEILRQHWAHIMSELQGNGAAYACLRGASGLTAAGSLIDEWNGLPHVRQIKKLREASHSKFLEQLELLDQLAAWLREQPPVIASCASGDGANGQIRSFLEQFPAVQINNSSTKMEKAQLISGRGEFFPLNAEVSSFARVLAAPHFTAEHSAGLEIYSQLLSCGHLWREIRLKNGAYAVHCHYSPFRRTLLLQSGDDPNPGRSRAVFERLAKVSSKFNWNDRDISDATIACLRDDERPWRPAQIVYAALLNRVAGYNEELRARRRRDRLAQSPESVRLAASHFWSEFATLHNDCLLGPVEQAQKLGLTPFQI